VIEEEEPQPVRRRRRGPLRIAGGVALLLVMAGGGLWLARKPIADSFIAGALRELGIEGRYEIVRIGPRTQRLENLVLGDSARPDLSARWVEVDLGYGLFSARVTGVRAGGVRLRGRLHDGTLDLGSLNKLLEGGGGGKTELPDIRLQLLDARASIATDFGPLGFSLGGTGNMRSGFSGDLGVASPGLRAVGCTLDRLIGPLRLGTESGRVLLKGPIDARRIDCPANGLALVAPRIDADLRTDPALESITGAFGLAASEARQGDRRLERLSGLITLKGSAEQMEGSAALGAAQSALGVATTGPIKIGGNFAVRPQAKDRAYSYSGALTVENARQTGPDPFAGFLRPVASTPLAPLGQKLVQAIRAAGGSNRLTVSARLSGEGSALQLLVNGLRFDARSGAFLALDEGSSFSLTLPKQAWALDGTMQIGGGGLPEARLALTPEPNGGLSGTLTMEDYRAGPARLGLDRTHFFRAGDGALQLRSVVALDGPLGEGGAVRGLVVPVDVRVGADGAFKLAGDCTPLRWSALRFGTASLDPARLSLCGIGGDALRLGAVRLTGRIGESPMRFSAESARYALGSGRFTLAGPDTQLGGSEAPIHLTAASLDGAVGKGGALSGTIAGGTAIIATVPLDNRDIAARWRFDRGILGVEGSLRISDRQADERFFPLVVPDARLELADGKITATGRVVHPGSNSPIAGVEIRHDLSRGTGQADFRLVQDLRFGGTLQPDDITPLALGIIANVDGPVTGNGWIRWTPQAVTSEGTFTGRDMSFAAAFGPVTGFTTTIHFTDLLGMKTAPHQRMTLKQVSAGVDVFDGEIDYALLSSQEAVIEGGRWPFSGGTLELLPATLAFDARRPRLLSFRVTGLNAGAFINTLELNNISATGTFDGLLPMIFDEKGGRIENGLLVARQEGLAPLLLSAPGQALPACDSGRQAGTLAYVGALSNEQLGAMGTLAFDALKHLRYKCLVIMLDGALDGEFVTRLSVNGVNQGTEEAQKSFLTRPFIGLPFIFNVRIEAPFRGLMNSAASLADPTALIRSQMGSQLSDDEKTRLAVQPADSEKTVKGNVK